MNHTIAPNTAQTAKRQKSINILERLTALVSSRAKSNDELLSERWPVPSVLEEAEFDAEPEWSELEAWSEETEESSGLLFVMVMDNFRIPAIFSSNSNDNSII